jgi:hypothetical protein
MAQVTVIFGGQNVGTHKVSHVPFTIGRDSSNDIAIDNVGVSRNHCKVTHDGKRFYIEDAGSSNGTYHRGSKIRKAPLGDGDEVQIGKHKLVFNRGPNELAPPPKGGVAAAAAGLPGGGGGAETEAVTDGMMTFKMDARLIHQQMAGGDKASKGPQRAAQLAGSMGGSSRRGGFFGKFIKFVLVLGLLAGVGAAVLYVLKTLKVIDF